MEDSKLTNTPDAEALALKMKAIEQLRAWRMRAMEQRIRAIIVENGFQPDEADGILIRRTGYSEDNAGYMICFYKKP